MSIKKYQLMAINCIHTYTNRVVIYNNETEWNSNKVMYEKGVMGGSTENALTYAWVFFLCACMHVYLLTCWLEYSKHLNEKGWVEQVLKQLSA